VSNKKAALARGIAINVKVVEVGSEDPPEVEDQIRYEPELWKELPHSYERLDVSESQCRKIVGQLQDLSVELADPLSLEVDEDVLGEDVSEESDCCRRKMDLDGWRLRPRSSFHILFPANCGEY